MASSRTSLNTPDWMDVATAIQALQYTLQGRIVIALQHTNAKSLNALSLTATLFRDDEKAMGPTVLASASAFVQGGGIGATDTALLSLLYDLDRDYYRRETGIDQTKAKPYPAK